VKFLSRGPGTEEVLIQYLLLLSTPLPNRMSSLREGLCLVPLQPSDENDQLLENSECNKIQICHMMQRVTFFLFHDS
jgi:hypothetical protein